MLAILLLFWGTWLGAGAANAGWRYTEWGMSEGEVRKASDGYIYPARRGQPAYWETLPRLIAPARFGGFEFLAEFYFGKKNKLIKVRLMPRHEIWCLDMFRRLNRSYSNYVGPEGTGYLWLDPKKGNRIVLSRFGKCTVTYRSASETPDP